MAVESESNCWNSADVHHPWYAGEFCGDSDTECLSATSSRGGVSMPRATARSTQNRMIGIARIRTSRGMTGDPALNVRCSYGFHQAVDERLVFVGSAVIAHLAVDDHATPEAVGPVALGDDVGRHRRQRRHHREGPRQRGGIDTMGLAVSSR